HCVVSATATAISSLYLSGIAPSLKAAWSNATNAWKASGVSSPNFFIFAKFFMSYIAILLVRWYSLPAGTSPAHDLELDGDVAARGVRVGADFLVRLFREGLQLGPGEAAVLDAHLDRQPEPPGVPRADRHGAGDLGRGGVLLVLLRHVVQGAAEAGRVAGGEQ